MLLYHLTHLLFCFLVFFNGNVWGLIRAEHKSCCQLYVNVMKQVITYTLRFWQCSTSISGSSILTNGFITRYCQLLCLFVSHHCTILGYQYITQTDALNPYYRNIFLFSRKHRDFSQSVVITERKRKEGYPPSKHDIIY